MTRHKTGMSALAAYFGDDVQVVDVGIRTPVPCPQVLDRKVRFSTGDIAVEPAMTEQQALDALAVGLDLARQAKAEGIDAVGVGEMGIGNTTTSSAVLAVLLSEETETAPRRGRAEAAPSKADFDARYLYLRACTNTREVSRSLQNLAKLARDHVANRHRVGSNEITNDIGTLVADIRTLVNAREDHADVTALRNRAADVITRIEDLQRRLMEAQPRGSMTIRCCEFHLSYLLVLRELVNHYEIASLLEEQIDALARGAKAA